MIPSGAGDKGKKAMVKWKAYQTRQPTEAELDSWQNEINPPLWAMLTGEASGVWSIDCETHKAAEELISAGLEPARDTPRGGWHFDFRLTDFKVKTMVALFPEVDVRGEGGYCNVVGRTKDGVYKILRYPTDDNLLSFDSLPLKWQKRIREESNKVTPEVTTEQDEVQAGGSANTGERILQRFVGLAKHGTRNATGFDLACQLRDNRITQADASPLMLQYANAVRDLPSDNGRHSPYTEKEALESLKSAYSQAAREPWPPPAEELPPNNVNMYKYNASGQNETEAKGDRNGTHIGTTSLQNEARDLSRFEGLSKRVRAWVANTGGWWETRELDSDLGISGPRDKENRKKILQRLHEQGIIEQHPKINKSWRYVDTRVTSLLFKTAATEGVLPVRWPLGIEKFVNLFPGNMAVVAGSPNSGKTALLLDFIRLNQEALPMYYFCSEMGAVELRNRLEQFPGMAIEDWKFQAIERASDFADVIRMDCVNIIDYLEMTVDLYAINTHLTAISHKIGSGLAVVALQKKVGAQFGRGQEFGLEKPKLYLSMDKGKLQIIKGKSWANKKVDPCGLEVSFKITGGCQFEITTGWDWKR